jgi:hypothetical protein
MLMGLCKQNGGQFKASGVSEVQPQMNHAKCLMQKKEHISALFFVDHDL